MNFYISTPLFESRGVVEVSVDSPCQISLEDTANLAVCFAVCAPFFDVASCRGVDHPNRGHGVESAV